MMFALGGIRGPNEAPPTHESAAGGDPSRLSPALTPAAVLVVVFTLAALFWPSTADGLLRILIATLVVGYVGAYAARAIPPRHRDPYAPFGRESLERNPPPAPRPLRDLERELATATATRSPATATIPPSVKRLVREAAARRLARNHGLGFDDPAHHDRIRSLVAHPTWILLSRGGDPEGGAAVSHPRHDPVPLSRLDSILDDLESL